MARYFVGESPMARLCRAEGKEKGKGVAARRGLKAVSYTHLDVYKRQVVDMTYWLYSLAQALRFLRKSKRPSSVLHA